MKLTAKKVTTVWVVVCTRIRGKRIDPPMIVDTAPTQWEAVELAREWRGFFPTIKARDPWPGMRRHGWRVVRATCVTTAELDA